MTRTSAVLCAGWLGLSAALACAPAAAQSASDAAAARGLFTEGVALADAGSWAEAVDRFERALVLRDSAVIAYNLGLALEHVGRPVEATERFRRVIRDEAADAQLRTDAEAGLRDAEASVAHVETRWDGESAGLSFFVDDAERPRALFGTNMPIDPGEHVLELRDEAGAVARGSVTVAAGESATLELTTLERSVELTPPTPVDEPEPGPEAPAPDDPTPWIALGVGGGIALVAGAIVLAVVLTPTPEAMAFSGSLGTVEIGR